MNAQPDKPRHGASSDCTSGSDRPRVAITGMGVVSPIGSGVNAFWSALCAGQSGMRPITRFGTEGVPYDRGGEIPALPAGAVPGGMDGEDDALRFAAAAAAEAIEDAGLGPAERRQEAGLVLSTNFGCAAPLESVLAGHTDRGAAAPFISCGFQYAADRLAACWGLCGPRAVLSLSCASGAAAIGWAADLVRTRRAAIAIACGFDALSLLAWSGLGALRTMTRDAVRPFDKSRSGTLFAEGAGALVLEDMAGARARGATLYAECLGYAVNNNAFHLTAPAKRGAGSARVMRAALADAGIGAEEVDHVNAHGTGTRHNDVTETQAIKDVFGERAFRIPVTSIKASTGHMMGAAGAVEAIAGVLSIRSGILPPTINFTEPDPECDLDYVLNEARSARIRTVLSNSAGIGGCNAAVLLRAAEEGPGNA